MDYNGAIKNQNKQNLYFLINSSIITFLEATRMPFKEYLIQYLPRNFHQDFNEKVFLATLFSITANLGLHLINLYNSNMKQDLEQRLNL